MFAYLPGPLVEKIPPSLKFDKNDLQEYTSSKFTSLPIIYGLHTIIIDCLSMIDCLKLVSPLFHQIFIFSPNESLRNYEKCFFFYLKSPFHSQDVQIFVIFPLLFHTSSIVKYKWEWNNYNVMNWLAQISRCHFWNNQKPFYINKLGRIIHN